MSQAELKEFLEKSQIQDVMSKEVIRIHEDEDMSVAQIKFLNHRVSHLVVVNRDEELVGIISHKYLYKAQSPRKVVSEQNHVEYRNDMIMDGDSFYDKEVLNSYILRHMMQKNPRSLKPTDSTASAIKLMRDKILGFIPIVDGKNHVVGVLSEQTIVRYLASLLS